MILIKIYKPPGAGTRGSAQAGCLRWAENLLPVGKRCIQYAQDIALVGHQSDLVRHFIDPLRGQTERLGNNVPVVADNALVLEIEGKRSCVAHDSLQRGLHNGKAQA